MMQLIEHPDRFKMGTRVLLLKGRHKDGIKNQRTITRVSHSEDQFNTMLEELSSISIEGERIYATAGRRDIKKAICEFKHRQITADYSGEPLDFYMHLNSRWISCLTRVESQLDIIWLFDCDDPESINAVLEELKRVYERPQEPYVYATKNGAHIVVQAFNRSALSNAANTLIHTNANMLWGY